jgi:hypothetical protein
LRAAADQLARSRAARKLTVLLSDCRHNATADTTGGGLLEAPADLGELVVVAPADDAEHAMAFAAEAGARMFTIATPTDIVGVLADL